jgi:hypothetical protein
MNYRAIFGDSHVNVPPNCFTGSAAVLESNQTTVGSHSRALERRSCSTVEIPAQWVRSASLLERRDRTAGPLLALSPLEEGPKPRRFRPEFA